jgi:guanylate kinase
MNYLFILGASGSGKTSLAKNLVKLMPDTYIKLTQNTTRPMRDNETKGVEYNFLSESDFLSSNAKGEMIAVVNEEFAPYRYGTPIIGLSLDKVNIVVAAIEGLLDSFNKIHPDDTVSVLFIKDVKDPEARKDRPFQFENKYTGMVIHKLKQGSRRFNLAEISHDELKDIRNDDEKMRLFIKNNNI